MTRHSTKRPTPETEPLPWERAAVPRAEIAVSILTRCSVEACRAYLRKNPDWLFILDDLRAELSRDGLRPTPRVATMRRAA